MPDDDKRARLLKAAKTTVARLGVAKATVAEVARTADITPGLVHYYFPSKQALIRALFDQLAVNFTARLATDGAPADRIRDFVTKALALGEGADLEAVRVWSWLSAEALRDDELRERWEGTVCGFIDRLAEAFAAHGTPAPREVAGGVVSGVLGAWQIGTVAADALEAGSTARTLTRLVEGLLALGPPGEASWNS